MLKKPVSSGLCRCDGRIFGRKNDSDIDITDNEERVYLLYARKQNIYFINKVYTDMEMDCLIVELLERARRMTRVRTDNHPWHSMTDEELLRSSGLFLKNPVSKKEELTLAAILLFGKDNAIMSVLPQHKTEAVLRIVNIDRYDDRDVIVTNLIVSARNEILREIISNSLAHRDYASGFIVKFVIAENILFTENSNQAHGNGNLDITNFKPFPKNPSISNVFREIGLADEPGSGIRNTYKYTKLYSEGTPEFIEGDVFLTIIPLDKAATVKAGPR